MTAAETIQAVQQCTTLAQLAELEATEVALPRPRKTVLDAILDQRTALTTVPGKGESQQPAVSSQRPVVQPAPKPAAAPVAQFKSMKGKVVVFGTEYTKEEALRHPEVMAALVRRRSLTLKGN